MSKNKRSVEASVGTRTATETTRKRSTLRKKSKFRSGEAEEHKEEESKSLTRSAIRTDERSAEVTAGTERKTKSEKRSKFRPSRKGKDAKEEKELGIFPFRPARMDSFSLSKRASTRSLTRLDEYSGNATDDASVADLTYAKMPSLHIVDIAREVRGLPSMRRAVVRVADMPDEMQQDAVDCSAHALELYGSEEERAAYIKKEFDKKYQATWHCVVGSDYGTYVTHDNRHFIFLFIGKMAILLFRS